MENFNLIDMKFKAVHLVTTNFLLNTKRRFLKNNVNQTDGSQAFKRKKKKKKRKKKNNNVQDKQKNKKTKQKKQHASGQPLFLLDLLFQFL